MSTDAYEEFKQKFKVAQLQVQQYKYWTWSLRPVQGTLGASVISLNRPAVAWSDVRQEENAELTAVVGEVEKRLQALFRYDKINYLMLMMVDGHVHFHVFPRYSAQREFESHTWTDSTWPKPPDLLSGISDPEFIDRVLERIRA